MRISRAEAAVAVIALAAFLLSIFIQNFPG